MSDAGLVQIMRRSRVQREDFYRYIQHKEAQKWEKLPAPQIPLAQLSRSVIENFVTPPETPAPDCLTCGLCCVFGLCVALDNNTQIEPEARWDIIAVSPAGRELPVDSFIRRDENTGQCVFLDGELKVAVNCSAYEQRPRQCREFAAGSDKCHALRRLYGLEHPLTPEQLAAAEEQLAHRTDTGPEKIAYAQITWEEDGANCLITGIFADGRMRRLHIYNPQQETWRQSEFIGLSIDQAASLIASRGTKESS